MQTPSSPGELGVRARHERRHLLVARLDELGPLAVARAPERPHQAVDAVAGVAVDPIDAPSCKAIQEIVAHRLAHACCSPLKSPDTVEFGLPPLRTG